MPYSVSERLVNCLSSEAMCIAKYSSPDKLSVLGMALCKQCAGNDLDVASFRDLKFDTGV